MESSKGEKSDLKPVVIRNCAGLQRMKLEKLMKNPDKPVIIPDRQKEKKLPHVPEFVRNVMGSSAGAGSGEFHVYRHLRRKEYSRQKYIQEKSEKVMLDEAYQLKLLENKQIAEERTAKKRAKRQKKKANRLKKVKSKAETETSDKQSNSDTEEETENEEQDVSEDNPNVNSPSVEK